MTADTGVCFPGRGNMDFASLLGRLESSGYRRHYAMAFGTNDDKLVAREPLAVEGPKKDLINFGARGSLGPAGRSG